MTVPITSATSEKSFSALQRLLTYLRSSMSEKRLNNCLLLHVHKEMTDCIRLNFDWQRICELIIKGKCTSETFSSLVVLVICMSV